MLFRSVKSSKSFNLSDITHKASKFLPETNAIPLWPAAAFARGDRTREWDWMLDNEKSLKDFIRLAKDRLISGQSGALQALDGIFTQLLQDKISASSFLDIDCRESWMLGNHFETGANLTRELNVYSLGGDEFGWGHYFTPQLWYLGWLIYRSAFAPNATVVVADLKKPALVDGEVMKQLDAMPPGFSKTIRMREGETGELMDVNCTAYSVRTDTLLRRIIAGCAGSDIQFGEIRVTGYQYVLDTPRDGKFLCGYSMRSGNFMTFLMNSFGNLIKHEAMDLASKREDGIGKAHL